MITIFSASLFAQARYDSDDDRDLRELFHFGVKVGANYSNVYDIRGEDFTADFKYGFVGGIFFEIPLGTFLGIRPEILYSQKGYESTGSVLGVGYKITHSADFIDIPLLLEVKPAEFVTIVAGPQFSYLIRQENDFNTANTFLSAQQQQTFDNINIRKNLLCLTGGLDFNIRHFVIGTRFGFDLMENNGDGTSTNPRYRNLWYQATLGLRF